MFSYKSLLENSTMKEFAELKQQVIDNINEFLVRDGKASLQFRALYEVKHGCEPPELEDDPLANGPPEDEVDLNEEYLVFLREDEEEFASYNS